MTSATIDSLSLATPHAGRALPRPERDLPQLREAAGRLVGQVFYGTMMKAMRASELKGPYGHGGRGEEAFAAQLDMHLAEEMGRSGRNPLVDGIVKAYERQQRAVSRTREYVLTPKQTALMETITV